MNTILLAGGMALLYIIAYNTYGKFLAGKIFNIEAALALKKSNQLPETSETEDIESASTT